MKRLLMIMVIGASLLLPVSTASAFHMRYRTRIVVPPPVAAVYYNPPYYVAPYYTAPYVVRPYVAPVYGPAYVRPYYTYPVTTYWTTSYVYPPYAIW